MGRYLSWIANSVLFILCCYLLANVANEVFAAILTPSPVEATKSPAPGPVQRHAWSERKVILDRNLFNASLLAPVAPVVVEEPEEDLAETKLPLRLLGTAAVLPPELSWAAVEDEAERRTVIVRVNDSLRDASVQRIERRRIVLREGGALRELTLDEEDDKAQAAGAGPGALAPQAGGPFAQAGARNGPQGR
jgi:hypothetical protein